MLYTTENKYQLKLINRPNIAIFSEIAKAGLKVPKPPTYLDDDGRLLENYFHPAYHNALSVYDLQRHHVATDGILKICVELLDKVDESLYKEPYQILLNSGLIPQNESLELWILKNYIINDNDLRFIVSNTLLTENRIADIFNSIRITRDGEDIHRKHIKNAVSTNIETDAIVVAGYQLVSPLDEINACKFSMMNWQEWLRCELSLDEKATAVALYRLDRVVENHANDVIQIHQERESKKRNKS